MSYDLFFAFYVYSDAGGFGGQLCGVVFAEDSQSALSISLKMVREQHRKRKKMVKSLWPKDWSKMFPELTRPVRKKDIWVQLVPFDELASSPGLGIVVNADGSIACLQS